MNLSTSTNNKSSSHNTDAHLLFSKACGKDLSVVEKDSQRAKYLSPEEAVEYGLIDRVLFPVELKKEVERTHPVYVV